MIEGKRRSIPENHPIRPFFRAITERGFEQLNVRDPDTIQYVSNLLTEFVDIKNVFRVKDESGQEIQNMFAVLQQASEAFSPEVRCEYYRHLGDLTLFNLGLYPEHLTYGRKTVSPGFYAEQGRRSYDIVATIDRTRATVVFRKLSDQFEQCVVGLNWVKRYINDPFYQYMLREFGVT
jgi:hypothetical protein